MEQAHPIAIGKYEILSVIGRGGMGVVYRAQNRLMGMQVAIKTVTEGLSSDSTTLKRFYEEAEKMGMLKHPNIITVYDLGEQDGFPYIVMEYVEGDPLDKIIASEKPVSLIFKLRIIEQVCAALSYAHQNVPPVIHRDVKPANVIVRPDGTAKLLDFGIARENKRNTALGLTEPGGVIGTVPYMAPERLRGGDLDGRSDIFATGVLLFQFLTGRLPFLGTEYVLVNQLLNDKHPPLSDLLEDYPRPLDAILDRALAKEPADRYQTADEMGADLYTVIESLKQDYSAHLMLQAERLSAAGDHLSARESVFQLMKLDNKNIQARRLLADLNALIARQAGAEQAGEKSRLAAEALREKNFDRAVVLLEEAVKLAPETPAFAAQLDSARAAKQTNDQILGYLRQADAAKRVGDYTGAREIVEKAIQLDTSNSRLRAAYNSLVRQAEEASQLARVKSMVESARAALANRDFLGVLSLVKQIELIDPSNVDLADLASAAREGIAQELRRKLFQEIEEQLSGSLTEDEARSVASVVYDALEKSPSDPTLLRYQSQADRRIRDFEVRRLVEDAVRRARSLIDSTPLEALDIVRQALAEVPGDHPENARLLALEISIQERIARLSAEETRNAILLRARDALKQSQFADAVRALEQCQGHLRTPEIEQLLEYARQEARQEEQRQLVARTLTAAQPLIADARFEDAVALLTPVAAASDDNRIRLLLDQARRALDQRRAELASALAMLRPYAEARAYEQVVAAIATLPPTTQSAPEIQSLLAASQSAWKQEWTRLESLGQAHAALATLMQPPSASPAPGYASLLWAAETLAATHPSPTDTATVQQLVANLAARRTLAADQVLTGQVDQIQTAKSTATNLNPTAELDAARKLLPFASEFVRAAWTSLADQYSGGRKLDKFLGRLGRKRT